MVSLPYLRESGVSLAGYRQPGKHLNSEGPEQEVVFNMQSPEDHVSL